MRNRLRLCSFTQESTRYCDFSSEKFGSELTFVMPPEISAVVPEGQYSRVVQAEANVEGGAAIFLIPAVEDGTGIQIDNADHVEWLAAMRNAEIAYHNTRKMGMTPEIARGVLPNALAAKITMTANMREWRHIFQLRALGATGRPHPQMVEVMDPLLREAKRRFPVFFDDL